MPKYRKLKRYVKVSHLVAAVVGSAPPLTEDQKQLLGLKLPAQKAAY